MKLSEVVFYERNKQANSVKKLRVLTMTRKINKKLKSHYNLIFYGNLNTIPDSYIFLL
jgi:hypothetical protein